MDGLKFAYEMQSLEVQTVAYAVSRLGAFTREIDEFRLLLRLAHLFRHLLKPFNETAHGVHDGGDDWRRRFVARRHARNGNGDSGRQSVRALARTLALLLPAHPLAVRALAADVEFLLFAVLFQLDRSLCVLLMAQFTLH